MQSSNRVGVLDSPLRRLFSNMTHERKSAPQASFRPDVLSLNLLLGRLSEAPSASPENFAMKPSNALLFFIAAAASFQLTAVEAGEAFVAQVNSSRALALPAMPSAATMLAAPVNAGFIAPSTTTAATKQNVSQLSQVGTNNNAMVGQIGAGNLSALSQQGHGNVAVVTQSNRSH